jgi:hypothetical protein
LLQGERNRTTLSDDNHVVGAAKFQKVDLKAETAKKALKRFSARSMKKASKLLAFYMLPSQLLRFQASASNTDVNALVEPPGFRACSLKGKTQACSCGLLVSFVSGEGLFCRAGLRHGLRLLSATAAANTQVPPGSTATE